MAADSSTTTQDQAAALTEGTTITTTAPNTNASLYVGELDTSVTEAMLFELFNMVGAVTSIRVCRDAVTRRSLGYAYVNYGNRSDAERALETLNYTAIKGRPCRIMWSQRDPSLRKTGAGNIFIKNLDASIDNKMLHDTFAAFGNILSCKVAVENGVSKGYGFVHYETPEAAEAAIKAVNGMLLNDKKVFVGSHVPRKDRDGAQGDEQNHVFTNVYVKNIDTAVTTDEFKAMFEKYGTITSAVIATDPHTGESKGFGFVNFEDPESAAKAVAELNDSDFRGKQLFVGRAQKKSEREEELKRMYENLKLEKMSKYQGVNLYVKNLEEDMDDEKLRELFVPFGMITSAKIMRDPATNASRGFGFVCFTQPEEATKALTEMNNRMVGSRPMYVALAQRKDVRKSQLEAQMQQRAQMRPMQPGMPMPVPGGPMYQGAPMFYAPGYPGAAAGRGMMFPGQPGMMPRGPRWAPNQPGMLPGPFPPQQAPYMSGVPAGMPMGRGRGSIPRGAAPMGAGRGTAGRGDAKGPAPRAAAPKNASGLTAAALAAAPPEQQKQMLGEVLFPLIHKRQADLAGKITGMLLEMDNAELLHLLDSEEALDDKVSEAVTVLKQHNIT